MSATFTERAEATLAGTPLGRHSHVCALVHDRDEEYRLLAPFVHEGLQAGEKAVHVTDPRLAQDHRWRLRACGVDVEAEERAGRLELVSWQQAYLRGGRFEPEAMLELLDSLGARSREGGFAGMRVIGHMDWALDDRPGVHRLLEYEARASQRLARQRDPMVCVYDLRRFDAATMVDVLRTHPMALVGGALRENPYFVPPARLLAELRERGAA